MSPCRGFFGSREPAGSFGDDFQAPHERIERLLIRLQGFERVTSRDLLGELDVAKDLAERTAFPLRRHTRCRARRVRASEA